MMAAKKKEAPVFQLKVTIKGIRPPIWRRLQVPGEATLADLHDILQTAFGWENAHLHQFVIGGAFFGVSDPMGGMWDEEMTDERRTSLRDAVGVRLKKFVYEYDFGDDWIHDIVVEKVLAPEAGVAYPRCLAGKRAGPPEDCGGPWGYAALLEAVGDPDHPEHAEMLEWLGEEPDPEAFNRDVLNVWLIPRISDKDP